MEIPKPSKATVDLFKTLVPNNPNITLRPMFGNISAFVNGNMFFGVFGNDLFIRLGADDQMEFLKKKGASNLEPMKGRPMKDYVIMPQTWRDEPQTMRSWISKSLAWSAKLPAKKKGK